MTEASKNGTSAKMVTVIHDVEPNELLIDFLVKNSHLRLRDGGNILCISDSGIEMIVVTVLSLGRILLNLKSTGVCEKVSSYSRI